MISELFDPDAWKPVEGFDFTDITYHRAVDQPTVRIAFNRPEVRNAFRPHTVDELFRALDHARMTPDVGCVLLTGNGPSPRDGGWAFCSGGDQRIRGRDGYKYAEGDTADTVQGGRAGRLGGRPKPQLEVGGRTMLESVLAAAAGATARIVVGPPQRVPEGVLVVREQPPGGGPVAVVFPLRTRDPPGSFQGRRVPPGTLRRPGDGPVTLRRPRRRREG